MCLGIVVPWLINYQCVSENLFHDWLTTNVSEKLFRDWLTMNEFMKNCLMIDSLHDDPFTHLSRESHLRRPLLACHARGCCIGPRRVVGACRGGALVRGARRGPVGWRGFGYHARHELAWQWRGRVGRVWQRGVGRDRSACCARRGGPWVPGGSPESLQKELGTARSGNKYEKIVNNI